MTDLFRELFGPGAALTKPETRMMVCDFESGYPLTNHERNDAGEWVCQVCGHNANAALIAAEQLATRIGHLAGMLSTMHADTRYHWLKFFVDVLVTACGEDVLQELVNICGRKTL